MINLIAVSYGPIKSTLNYIKLIVVVPDLRKISINIYRIDVVSSASRVADDGAPVGIHTE